MQHVTTTSEAWLEWRDFAHRYYGSPIVLARTTKMSSEKAILLERQDNRSPKVTRVLKKIGRGVAGTLGIPLKGSKSVSFEFLQRSMVSMSRNHVYEGTEASVILTVPFLVGSLHLISRGLTVYAGLCCGHWEHMEVSTYSCTAR